jgi:hypothetical protein
MLAPKLTIAISLELNARLLQRTGESYAHDPSNVRSAHAKRGKYSSLWFSCAAREIQTELGLDQPLFVLNAFIVLLLDGRPPSFLKPYLRTAKRTVASKCHRRSRSMNTDIGTFFRNSRLFISA